MNLGELADLTVANDNDLSMDVSSQWRVLLFTYSLPHTRKSLMLFFSLCVRVRVRVRVCVCVWY